MFGHILLLSNSHSSEGQTALNWEEILVRSNTKKKEKKKVVNEITNYYFKRDCLFKKEPISGLLKNKIIYKSKSSLRTIISNFFSKHPVFIMLL